MPVVSCTRDGKLGYKYGTDGQVFTYNEGDEQGRIKAKQQAYKQGIEIERLALNAFCPTGEGGGIDNSCSSRDGGGGDSGSGPSSFKFKEKQRVVFRGDPEAKGTITSVSFDPDENDEPIYTVKLDSGGEEITEESELVRDDGMTDFGNRRAFLAKMTKHELARIVQGDDPVPMPGPKLENRSKDSLIRSVMDKEARQGLYDDDGNYSLSEDEVPVIRFLSSIRTGADGVHIARALDAPSKKSIQPILDSLVEKGVIRSTTRKGIKSYTVNLSPPLLPKSLREDEEDGDTITVSRAELESLRDHVNQILGDSGSEEDEGFGFISDDEDEGSFGEEESEDEEMLEDGEEYLDEEEPMEDEEEKIPLNGPNSAIEEEEEVLEEGDGYKDEEDEDEVLNSCEDDMSDLEEETMNEDAKKYNRFIGKASDFIIEK